jgi:altronate dehydratase large subunit
MKFNGYKRSDGHVGIRNHVIVMPGVICAAGVAQKIANKTDAVYLYNPNGCAQNSSDSAIPWRYYLGLSLTGMSMESS